MWLPKTEKEIIDAVQSGALSESSIFDAKKELPSKNQEIAKDVAAMANDGGVIIFGIGEDDNKQLKVLNPIPLAGVAEKVDAIVRSSLSEPPSIIISSIPTESNPSLGYVTIFVPPSDRAPHMVVVNGDNRFYGRTATGNSPLSEGEVARLYARRKKTELDRDLLLEDEISSFQVEYKPKFSYLYLFTRPLFIKEGFFDSIITKDRNLQTIINEQIQNASSEIIFKPGVLSPDFRNPDHWKRRVEGLFGHMGYETRDPEIQHGATLDIYVDFNGVIHLFTGAVADVLNDNQKYIFPDFVAGITTRFLELSSSLYELSKYIGLVDVGIALTEINGCFVYIPNAHRYYYSTPYNKNHYLKTGRFSNPEIHENSKKTAKLLLNPFFAAISQNRVDPFKDYALD